MSDPKRSFKSKMPPKNIQNLQDKIYFKNINDLIFKAENFWVNNNFNSSPENILIFLESYLDKEIRYDN